MKRKLEYVVITLILLVTINGFGQCATHACDPQLTGLTIDVECIDQNGNANLILSWGMGGGDPLCTVPPGSWGLQISLPLTGEYGVVGIQDITGPGFNWTYSVANKTFTGINNIQQNWLAGDDVTINITGFIVTSCALKLLQTNIFILPTFLGGCPQAFNNNITNDAFTIGKGVQTPLPIELSRFTAKNGECGEAIIEWETSSERNSDYVDVERSEDGTKFMPVQRVKSNNQNKTSFYTYTDKSLVGGKRYFYRLRQVDFDGKTIQFNMTSLLTNFCSTGDLSMSLHPNPAVEKVFVTLQGFNENDNVTLVVTNAIGEQVMTIKNALIGGPNELKLNSLPAGIYNVKISGFDEVTAKRFIKID